MSKLFDALTRSLLEKYPADWLNQLGLLHGEASAGDGGADGATQRR